MSMDRNEALRILLDATSDRIDSFEKSIRPLVEKLGQLRNERDKFYAVKQILEDGHELSESSQALLGSIPSAIADGVIAMEDIPGADPDLVKEISEKLSKRAANIEKALDVLCQKPKF